MMMPAIALYRDRFRPSAQLAAPYVMLGFNVFAADSDEDGELLATSLYQAFVNLRSGRPGKLPRPQPGYRESLPMEARLMLDDMLSSSAIGAPASVRAKLDAFVERTGADELMITSQIHDHAVRLKSYALLAEAVATA